LYLEWGQTLTCSSFFHHTPQCQVVPRTLCLQNTQGFYFEFILFICLESDVSLVPWWQLWPSLPNPIWCLVSGQKHPILRGMCHWTHN
jgi:hypothetical protein